VLSEVRHQSNYNQQIEDDTPATKCYLSWALLVPRNCQAFEQNVEHYYSCIDDEILVNSSIIDA
jgi:hypothetical protein